jgi:hypothetical protein
MNLAVSQLATVWSAGRVLAELEFPMVVNVLTVKVWKDRNSANERNRLFAWQRG